MGALHIGIVYHSIFCNRPIPISIAAVLQAASTPNLPGSETTVFSLSSNASTLYGFITLSDKQSISTLESESVAAVAMLNNALAGRNRSASDVSRFRISSVQLRNHEVGYFDPLLWAVRVMICVEFFCIGGKCSVVLCLKNRKSGGVSSLTAYFNTRLLSDYYDFASCHLSIHNLVSVISIELFIPEWPRPLID